MPCYHPLTGVRASQPNKSGKYGVIVVKAGQLPAGYSARDQLQLPCGQCIGCRLERSRQWAIRCVHEASTHEQNSFITLTYNSENVPKDFGLKKEDFQKFMKRLRKHYEPKKIRYFHCGEYGEKNLRPHYHACLFGLDFQDKQHYATREDIPLYTSATLARLWPNGFSTIGEVNFETAAYTARYIMKKVNANGNKENIEYCGKARTKEEIKAYSRVDPQTGETYIVPKEYTTMSRRPGIGAAWFKKYGKETERDDNIIIRGRKMQPPKYYDGLYEDIETTKEIRKRKLARHAENNTPERLKVREKCKIVQMKSLKRSLDED